MDYDLPSEVKDLQMINPWKLYKLSETEKLAFDQWRRTLPSQTEPLELFDWFTFCKFENSPFASLNGEPVVAVDYDHHRDQYSVHGNESEESKSDDDDDGQERNEQHMEPSDNMAFLANSFLEVLQEIVELLSKVIDAANDDDDAVAAATADDDDDAAADDDI
ncbi:hypothetical protein Dimus_030045 [Dionaea muscipula]